MKGTEKYLLSAFSDEYADSFTEQLKGMERLGIGYIELRFADKKNVSVLTEEELKEVRSKLDAFGIGVSSIGSPLGKIKLDGDMPAHFDTAKRIFETANLLGAKNVRVFSFYPPEGRDIAGCEEEVFERVEQLLELGERYGVTLCHENEGDIYGESPERCLSLEKRFGGRLRIVFDMGNYVCRGYEPYPHGFGLLRDYIEYFHIKDATLARKIVVPGTGDAKIREILSEFAKTAEKPTFVTLEPHLTSFSGMNALNAKTAGAVENAFSDAQTAFAASAASIKEILENI